MGNSASVASPPLPASDQEPTDSFSGLVGCNIFCFAKDWNEDPTSCNHVLRELAKHNRVVWLNSIGTRAPSVTSGRDMGKLFSKIAAFLRGPVAQEENLWVFTPLLLPFHKSAAARRINRWIIKHTFRVLQRKLGMPTYQLWTFVPTSAKYLGCLDPSVLVYYCTDNWSSFSTVDTSDMESMVSQLAKTADVVFATSTSLVEKLAEKNPNTFLASHGVKYDLFRTALSDELSVPEDLLSLQKPVVGYYGLIEDWMDLDLVAAIAKKHPEWSIVLIGKVMVDTSAISSLPNVHLLGRKPHHELPAYCKGFSVGILPHKVNSLTINMNPIKLREYLSAGLPVVATDLPEVRRGSELCVTTKSYEEFEEAVAAAIASDTRQKRRERSESMSLETWDRKVEALGKLVSEAQSRKYGSN